MKPTFSQLHATCPYHASYPARACDHKYNPQGDCKAKLCPKLDYVGNVIPQPETHPTSPRKRIKPILEPVWVQTKEGRVALKDWLPLNEGWHGNLGKKYPHRKSSRRVA